MMKTRDSWPPRRDCNRQITKVQTSDPVSVSTMAEINLFLTGKARFLDWFHFMESNTYPDAYVGEIKSLRSLMYTLPSQYDLLWSRGMFPITYYYKSTYTSGSSSSHDRNSRPVILMNLTEMLEFMCTWKRRFKEAVHERNRPEYERLYGWTLSA